MDTLDSLFDYLESGEGEVGIFDATNSTRQRRKAILDRVKRRFEGTGKDARRRLHPRRSAPILMCYIAIC